jgi:type I restriction enzyme S subunit
MTTTINNEHKKLNVPNLRFPEFQGEWEKHELGDICETITDFVAAGSFASLRENVKYYQEDNYAQLVRTVDLKKDFTNNDFVYVDELAYDFLWRVQLKESNIVLPNIGANIGEKYYVSPEDLPKEKNVLGPNAILLRSKCNDTHFVYFRLSTSSYDNEMKKLVGASGQPKFNKTDLKKVRLFMPSLKEQKKISHFLGLLEERIATQNKIIDKLQSLIKGIRNDVFGKLRKDIGLNAKVGDVLSYEQPQPYIVEDTEYTAGGTPVLTANKAFVLGYTSETDGIYDKGDCIIFDDFTLDCKYVDFPFKVKSSAIKILTAKNKELLRYTFEFLKYLDLSTDEHKRHYIAETQNQEFILPTTQIVRTIAHAFSTLSSRMQTIVKQRDMLELQKQYLLRQMFI